MKNNNLVISLLIIILASVLGGYLLRRHVVAPVPASLNQNPSYTFMCPDNKSITATFHLPDDASVDIVLSDGRTMNLAHAMRMLTRVLCFGTRELQHSSKNTERRHMMVA